MKDSNSLIGAFFSPETTSLKVCGITRPEDAWALVEREVPALGINFWQQSKRYCSPERAQEYAPAVAGQILRVGVFVNAPEAEVLACYEQNLIDVAQFHGDEDEAYLADFTRHALPFIKAIGVSAPADLAQLQRFHTPYLLLDAHAPGVYGGTGESIDWTLAGQTVRANPDLAIMLAGGVRPDNAAEATKVVLPCALDVASGAESAPGVKDMAKVQALLAGCAERG